MHVLSIISDRDTVCDRKSAGRNPRIRIENLCIGGNAMAPSSFSHMILDVRDLDRSLEFYHGFLHLPIRGEEASEGSRIAYLGTGATEILLVQQAPEIRENGRARCNGLVIKFRVQNLPQVAQSLEQGHVPVLRDLEMAVWGERTILVADPDGYAVLLSEPVETVH